MHSFILHFIWEVKMQKLQFLTGRLLQVLRFNTMLPNPKSQYLSFRTDFIQQIP